MKIVLFGGSFNPIHRGHIKLAEEALNFIGGDILFFIPTYHHPFNKKVEVKKEDIVNMIRLALEEYKNPKFKIDTYEIEQDNPTYTINTIKKYLDEYPSDEIFLLIGFDNVKNFDKWKDYREILKKVRVIAGSRGKTSDLSLKDIFIEGRIFIFNSKAPDISASTIREKIKEGNIEEIKSYLPKSVLDYIIKNNLYK